jgi:hypothetical protein
MLFCNIQCNLIYVLHTGIADFCTNITLLAESCYGLASCPVLSDSQIGLHIHVGQKVEETWDAPKLLLLKDAEDDLRGLLVKSWWLKENDIENWDVKKAKVLREP